MVKIRLIACLLWRDGSIVQSVRVKHTNVIGSATTAVDFFNIWGIDEIVLLDVSRSRNSHDDLHDTVEKLSHRCMVPLTVGGWVTELEDIHQLLKVGADKIAINTAAVRNPDFVDTASRRFGQQCIVVSIDAIRSDGKGFEVVVDRGCERTGRSAVEWASTAESLGAGEIFLTSIDGDGTKDGYDLDLIRAVVETVSIPVVASGGVGEWEHLVEAIEEAGADAVSVANRFHPTQHSTRKAKEFLIEAGLDVREPYFYNVDVPRQPTYDVP